MRERERERVIFNFVKAKATHDSRQNAHLICRIAELGRAQLLLVVGAGNKGLPLEHVAGLPHPLMGLFFSNISET